jgi:hypothetical protein
MTSEELILHFVSLVASGGGLTLNVSPSADGQIPLLQQERLLDLGQWLETNGEAIYGTKPYELAKGEFIEESDSDSSSVIDFNWIRNAPKKGMPEDNFEAIFFGKITPKYSEEYTIYLEADDKAELIIYELKDKGNEYASAFTNIQESVDVSLKDSAFANKPLKVTIKLNKNKKYAIWVFYEEKDLNASVSLMWESKHTPKEFIKADWEIEYSWNTPAIYLTQKGNDLYAIVKREYLDVKREYLDKDIYLSLPKMPKADLQITCLDNEHCELPWQYKYDRLCINTTEIKNSKIKSKGAIVLVLENYLAD